MNGSGWRGKIILETLTPVHVGTGERLIQPKMEYAVTKNGIARLNLEKFLQDPKIPLMDKENYFSGPIQGKIFDSMKKGMETRYLLKPACGNFLGKEVREAIKICGDRPYIPGSSLKGAVRTAIAWLLCDKEYLTDRQKNQALNAAGRKPDKFKAGELEKYLFTEMYKYDAKADAMKALMIRDSSPVSSLELRLYDIYILRYNGAERKLRQPLGLEAVPPETTLTFDVKVSADLLRWDREYRPGKNTMEILLNPKKLTDCISKFSHEVTNLEEKHFTKMKMPEVATFFNQHRDCLLPIGFGTGWHTKTIGTRLGPAEIKQARVKFRRGFPPPKSRRLALDHKQDPVLPVGWARFDLQVEEESQ